MSNARYLVRFDDICPTMNWDVWEQLDAQFVRLAIRPILAVVPDNQDPHLRVADARGDFWERVREWQARGWCIGLHGCRHAYDSSDPGIVGLNTRSEFAGIATDEQERRLAHALGIFQREQVHPDCWIAPGHSFDWETLRLLRERGIRVVSDGYFRHPVVWRGSTWVPQQLWRFRRMPAGLWTVCLHHNSFKAIDIERMAQTLERYAQSITDMRTVVAETARECTLPDRLLAAGWRAAINVKRLI